MPGMAAMVPQAMEQHQPFSYQNLLQELLMALLGYTGDVFVDSCDLSRQKEQLQHPGTCTVKLAADISWLEARDREPLNDIVRLGFHYKQLRLFVERQQAVDNRSAYRRALCSGMREFLQVYQDAIVDIQQEVLACPGRGLPLFQYHLVDLQLLVPQLHALVWELQRPGDDQEAVRGAELLQLMHKHCLNGQPALQSCFQRLLWHCNQALFQQLTAWMVHGMLVDEGNEFFIQPAYPLPDTKPDGSAWSEEEITYHEWHSAFGVNTRALPPGVPQSLAQSIEFVGKAVRLLRKPAGSFKGAELLPYGDTLELAQALGRLAAEPVFSQVALERTTEAIRADVAARLWELLVVQAGLMGHLGALKDYCLLAKGDFWHSFLVDSQRLMSGPPRPATADADVGIPFTGAALKSTAQHDPHFSLFRLHFSDKPLQVQTSASVHTYIEVPAFDERWDHLWLEHRLPWPLGLLLTPGHLARYNALFQLLLRLKRVQLHLETAWQELGRMCGRGGGGTSSGRDLAPLLQLRQHMAHLVSNLQVYLQVDVIESNYSVLEQRIAAAQDFWEAERAHERYLHNLVTQSFLSHASLCRQFGEVFGQARDLCQLVAQARANGVDWGRVKAIAAAFDGTISSLYVNLQSRTLQQYDKAPHLRQLYLRLDFNGYIGEQRMKLLSRAKTAAHQAGPSARHV